MRATRAYSESICLRSESPVFASGIEIMLRPFKKATAHMSICSTSTSRVRRKRLAHLEACRNPTHMQSTEATIFLAWYPRSEWRGR